MKIIINNAKGFLLLLQITCTSQLFAQDKFILSESQKFTVEGTSTIHDWEMVSELAEGTTIMKLHDGKLKSIQSLVIKLPVKTLKSGKSGMDKNAYEALNAGKHPSINFELIKVTSISDELITVRGKLSIAGMSKEFEIRAEYGVNGNGIKFSGEFPIKFSEFNIDPPTAVFGTIKTGNDLKVKFETTFKTKN